MWVLSGVTDTKNSWAAQQDVNKFQISPSATSIYTHRLLPLSLFYLWESIIVEYSMNDGIG